MNIFEELEEVFHFNKCKITQTKMDDASLYIASYEIGGSPWLTLFEVYSTDDFTRVNVEGVSLKEYTKT